MNQHDQMREALLAAEVLFAELGMSTAQEMCSQALAAEPAPLVRLTDKEIEALRHKTFSTNNPFCPCDAKTMRKAANAIMDAFLQKNGADK